MVNLNPNPIVHHANRVQHQQNAQDPDEAQRQRIQRLIGQIGQSHQKMDKHLQAIEVIKPTLVNNQQKIRQTLEKVEDPVIQEKFNHIEELKEEMQDLQEKIQVKQVVAQETFHDIRQKQDAIQENLQQLVHKKGVLEEIYGSAQKITTILTNLAKEGVIALHEVAHQSINWLVHIPEAIHQKLSDYTWSKVEQTFLHPISLIAIAILLYLAPVAGAILCSIVIYILAKKIYDFILPHVLLILQKH